MLKPFLYNSIFINKVVKLLCFNGSKERIENKILYLFKNVDFFLLFEFVYNLKIPFKLFPLKKRSGRHAFIRVHIVSYISIEEQLMGTLGFFKKEINSKKFSYEKTLKQLTDLITISSVGIINLKKQKQKQAIFLQKLHHYRW